MDRENGIVTGTPDPDGPADIDTTAQRFTEALQGDANLTSAGFELSRTGPDVKLTGPASGEILNLGPILICLRSSL